MKFRVMKMRERADGKLQWIKTYTPDFTERYLAERVARRASEKHPDCVILVQPVKA